MNIQTVVASSAALLLRIFALILFGRTVHLFVFSLFAASQVPGSALPESVLRVFLLSALEATAIWFGARPVAQMLVTRRSFGASEDRAGEESAAVQGPRTENA